VDDDPVLRSLADDLARDDPRLAALLDGTRPVHRHRLRALVLLVAAVPLATLALLLPPTVALGAVALVLALASPVVVLWLCAGDRSVPRPR